jgi:choline dehydrogenase-like flavoprotein
MIYVSAEYMQHVLMSALSHLLHTDASAIPAPLSGNIQATVQAVAYRAADFILKNANSNS